MLYRFRLRKDAPCHRAVPAGYCFGWDCSLAPDYAASGFIMVRRLNHSGSSLAPTQRSTGEVLHWP